MSEEQYPQEQMPEEEAKKPSRRRLIVYGVVGAVVICILCSVAYNLVFPSDDGGEPASLPEEIPTAVQLPEETSIPTNTLLPTTPPTDVPTEVPTETPAVVEDAQAEYFEDVLPGVFVMGITMQNIGHLFEDPDLTDIDWYVEVTSEMSDLLDVAIELNEFPVPDGCDKCRGINDEFSIIETHVVEASEDWFAWLQDQGEASHLDSMAEHITEIGNAAIRASAIIEE